MFTGVSCHFEAGGAEDTDLKSALVAQLVERVLGKDEVTGSSPVIGSRARVRSVELGAAVVFERTGGRAVKGSRL